MPWLRLSAELDPQRIQTYIVASFWLRTELGKVEEAEQFLREGLRANPGSYEILFELGRVQEENHKNTERARNLYQLALTRWERNEAAGNKPDPFAYQQIVGFLARLEERTGNVKTAIFYLEKLKEVSSFKDSIEAQINELEKKSVSNR